MPLFEDVAVSWAKARKKTHRSGGHDHQRMKRHLLPVFMGLRLDEITTGQVRRLIDIKQEELSPATVERCLALLSRFYNEMIERDMPLRNPVAALDRATRRRVRSTHDPRKTPFLRTKEEIRQVYLTLPEHFRPVFAVGAFGGLRKNEILGLRWPDIDLRRRRITVQRQKVHGKNGTGPLKDNESRVVPINDTLLEVLRVWKLRGPRGTLIFRSRIGTMVDDHTPGRCLRGAASPDPHHLVPGDPVYLRLTLGDGRPAHRKAARHLGPQQCHHNRKVCPPTARRVQRGRSRCSLC